jgi:hypothetical protein
MTKYTFTFPAEEEKQFNRIVERLDPEEFTVLEPIGPVDKENPRRSDRQTVMEMEAEAALTFRMGMKEVKIRRERTEEELKAEEERDARNRITIRVQVPPDQMPGAVKGP